MSKADRLGAGTAFGTAARARSSRRDAIDNAIKGDNASATAVTDLPVTLISENPDNPRNHLRNLDETVDSVRELGVILPIVVATTEAYLHDRPDRADDLDDGTQYLVVDGHRRLEAARRVGLATIPVRVDDSRVSTDESLLEAAFVTNYHRDDMTDLEEAHALKQLVDYYGSQTKASKRLGIPQNTISSKLSLLKLTPELQKDLMTGARKVDHVRNLGKLAPEEQKAKADARAEAAQQKTRVQAQPEESPADYHGVIIPEASSPTTSPSSATASPTGDLGPVSVPAIPSSGPTREQTSASASEMAKPTVPDPRVDGAGTDSEAAGERRQVKMPWHDGVACAEIAISKMAPEERDRMVERLVQQQQSERREHSEARTA